MLYIETYFEYVCLTGDLDGAKYVKDMHPNMNMMHADMRCLYNACKRGHLHICEWLLQFYIGDRCIDDYIFDDYMNITCENGHLSVAQWLYEHFTFDTYYRALYDAIEHNHFDIVQWLHNKCKEPFNESMFVISCQHNNLEMCKFIHSNIDTMHIKYYIGALHNACIHNLLDICKWIIDIEPKIAIDKWFFDLKPEVDHIEQQKFNLVLNTCKFDTLPVLKWLYDVNRELFHNADTLLTQAIFYGQYEICLWLMHEDQDLDLHAYDITFNCLENYDNKTTLQVCKWMYKTNKNSLTTTNFNEIFTMLCVSCDMDVVQWLYSLKSELKITNNNFINIKLFEHIWYYCGSDLAIFEWLFSYASTDICEITNMPDPYYNNLHICRWICEHFNVLLSANEFKQLLKVASEEQDLEFCKWLLDFQGENDYKLIFIDIDSFYFEKPLPTKIVNEILNCPICDAKSNVITDCDHQFCKSCLQVWLKNKHSCPYCRHELDKDDIFHMSIVPIIKPIVKNATL
mgnify:CR=1 FL=1|jgi:hypothetical protein